MGYIGEEEQQQKGQPGQRDDMLKPTATQLILRLSPTSFCLLLSLALLSTKEVSPESPARRWGVFLSYFLNLQTANGFSKGQEMTGPFLRFITFDHGTKRGNVMQDSASIWAEGMTGPESPTGMNLLHPP